MQTPQVIGQFNVLQVLDTMVQAIEQQAKVECILFNNNALSCTHLDFHCVPTLPMCHKGESRSTIL